MAERTTNSGQQLYTVMANAHERRERIREHLKEGIMESFPVQGKKFSLEIEDVDVNRATFSQNEQKKALLEGTTLVESVTGTVILKDTETGKELDRSKRTLAHLPYFTERHTFIMKGNEYTVANQVRIKPGVYTRERGNGELEAAFNLARGQNFRIVLDPEKGIFHLQYGTSNTPLYVVLRALGVSHQAISREWGQDLADLNRNESMGKETQALTKIYKKLVPAYDRESAPSQEEMARAIKEVYLRASLDPEVTMLTLGKRFERVDDDALLRASKKLLKVFNEQEEQDDRDSLAYKTLHTVESFMKERVAKDAAPTLRKKMMRKLNQNIQDPKVRDFVPTAPYTKSLQSFLTTSSLSNTPMQINPMEVIDSSVKITSLGEGGISSHLAVPDEARDIHSTHFGIIDPIRTPESMSVGIDVRSALHAARDNAGNLYTPVYNVKTRKTDYLSATEMSQAVIAFPGQDLKGGRAVSALKNGRVQSVPIKEVQYQLVHAASMYSPATNLVPFLNSAQGNRNIMGAKMQTQALPLKEREAPYVQVKGWRAGETVEKEFARMTLPFSPEAGTIEKIDDDYIYIRPDFKKVASGLTATIVMGNPKYVSGNPLAKKFYEEIKEYLEERGYNTEIDPGLPYTTPPRADLWVGHSRGVDRLRFAPPTTKTMAVGSSEEGAVNHPVDAAWIKRLEAGEVDGESPPREHYIFTPDMKRALDKIVREQAHRKTASCAYMKTASIVEQNDGLIRVPYSNNFPLMSKTFIHDDLKRKVGDHVDKGETLADNNFTRDNTLALGKNLSVAYIPYYGKNSNDAVVISASAASKLTSLHMYKESLTLDPTTTIDKEKHRAYFGAKYDRRQYDQLDTNGVVKRGAKVQEGDLLIAALQTSQMSSQAAMLGKLHKSLVKPYRDAGITWEHQHQGSVVDVAVTSKQVTVSIRCEEPMKIGDKLSNRHGAKGVVSTIVPDAQMIKDEAGRPVDVLLTSAGVITRINPSQIIESAVGKVAEKTGKPIEIDQFADHDNVQWAKDLLKKHNIKDKETVYDPVSGKSIPNIHVGRQYTFKLFKSSETNFAGRGVGPGYDANQQPTKGGDEGAKSIGKMEANALLAHGARAILRDAESVKGQRNDEYWRKVQLGLPAAMPTSNFAYDKFLDTIQGSGVKVTRQGHDVRLGPMTDNDIDRMANHTITSALLVKTKTGKGVANIEAERGGLFDPVATGGLQGTKYSKIELSEPVVNPVFEDPVRRLLGLNTKDFQKMQTERGGAYFKEELNKLDLHAKEKELLELTKKRRGSSRNDAVKQLKYLSALKQENLRAGDAYVISKVPVTPPIVRPVTPTSQGTTLVADSNYLYRDLMLANESFRDMPEELATPEEVGRHRQHLNDSVSALFGLRDPVSPQNQGRGVKGHIMQITGTSSPKSGYFHDKLMSRRQDLTGRATIVPDATLGIDEVGMPEDMAWSMYEPFIIRRLVQNGYSAIDARNKVQAKDHAARKALDREIQERPALINRAPSLHRYNVVAAYPKLVSGKSLHINPFVEAGTNADYDGDAMQVHVPSSDDAVREAKGITLSKLLFGDQTRDSLMVFPAHEAIIGTYKATEFVDVGPERRFKTKAEAVAAYKRGEIKMSTPVKIG